MYNIKNGVPRVCSRSCGVVPRFPFETSSLPVRLMYIKLFVQLINVSVLVQLFGCHDFVTDCLFVLQLESQPAKSIGEVR